MKQKLGTTAGETAPYISLFWASLMIGRWTSSAEAFGFSAGTRKILQFLMPYLAFGVFLLVNAITNHDVQHFLIYGLVIIVPDYRYFLSMGNPARQLIIFSAFGIIALLVGIFSNNPHVSVFAFCSVGLFCSTLWPCIFTLSISGLVNIPVKAQIF